MKKPVTKTGSELKEPRYSILRGAESNNLEEVKGAIAENPACINAQDPKTLMTALHWVGANRNLAIGEHLFDQQRSPAVDPWLRDKFQRLPVDLAIQTGNQSLIQLFHRKMFAEDFAYDFDALDPPEGVRILSKPKFGEDGPA